MGDKKPSFGHHRPPVSWPLSESIRHDESKDRRASFGSGVQLLTIEGGLVPTIYDAECLLTLCSQRTLVRNDR